MMDMEESGGTELCIEAYRPAGSSSAETRIPSMFPSVPPPSSYPMSRPMAHSEPNAIMWGPQLPEHGTPQSFSPTSLEPTKRRHRRKWSGPNRRRGGHWMSRMGGFAAGIVVTLLAVFLFRGSPYGQSPQMVSAEHHISTTAWKSVHDVVHQSTTAITSAVHKVKSRAS